MGREGRWCGGSGMRFRTGRQGRKRGGRWQRRVVGGRRFRPRALIGPPPTPRPAPRFGLAPPFGLLLSRLSPGTHLRLNRQTVAATRFARQSLAGRWRRRWRNCPPWLRKEGRRDSATSVWPAIRGERRRSGRAGRGQRVLPTGISARRRGGGRAADDAAPRFVTPPQTRLRLCRVHRGRWRGN